MNKFINSALVILSESKNPMSAIEITERALKKGVLKSDGITPDQSMGAILYTDMKDKKEKSYFILSSPGRFILNPFMKNEIVKDKEVKNLLSKENKPYTTDELELIFSLPPTRDNCKKLAKVLGRTERAIEQQYQMVMLSDAMLEEKNKKHDTNWNVHMNCREVSKKLGWIRTY